MTSLQKRVYEVVKKIPRGEVLTYKEVAEFAEHPLAFRAVGNILNKNRNPKIPCHRVVRISGGVGEYNKGREKKLALLKREGVVIKNDKVVILK